MVPGNAISLDYLHCFLIINLRIVFFNVFFYHYSEEDLESVLLKVLRMEGNIATFLGDRQSPLCIDMPPPPASQSGKPSNSWKHHQLLRLLTHVTPLHSRRYQPPTLGETTSSPSPSSDHLSPTNHSEASGSQSDLKNSYDGSIDSEISDIN